MKITKTKNELVIKIPIKKRYKQKFNDNFILFEEGISIRDGWQEMGLKGNKDKKNFIIRLPLFQNSYDAVGELIGKVSNLVGIIGKEYSISQLIDLGYKGDVQEGSPIIMFENKDELIKVCKEAGIAVWELPICSKCGEEIRGCYTYGDKGELCLNCD